MTNPRRMALEKAVAQFGKPIVTMDDYFDYVWFIIGNMKSDRVLGLYMNVAYSERTSNTHSSPVDGVENWRCKDELPKGYPGMRGEMYFVYDHSKEKRLHSIDLGQFAIHTGTGGYRSHSKFINDSLFPDMTTSDLDLILQRNPSLKDIDHKKRPNLRYLRSNYSVGYDFRMYLSDFPDLQRTIEMQIMADVLHSSKRRVMTYNKTRISTYWAELCQNALSELHQTEKDQTS